MRHLLLASLLLLAMAALPPASAIAAESELGQRQLFRAYPHADRAQRLATAGEHERAIEAWERALRRAPGHPPYVHGLIESLIAIGAHERALERSAALPPHQTRAVRDELRLLMLADTTDPDAAEINRWLEDTTIPRIIVHRAAERVAATAGDAAAARWLEGVACTTHEICVLILEDRLQHLQRSASPAPEEIAAVLAELDRERGLSDIERAIRVDALLAAGHFDAAGDELARISDDTIFRGSARNLIHRAADRTPEAAEAAFAALAQRELLEPDQADDWLQRTLTGGDPERSLALAAELGRPCIERAELARMLGRDDAAREILRQCDPATAPVRWAWLAAHLEAWALLEEARFTTAEAETLRRDLLVEHYLARGDDAALATLLTDAEPRHEVIRAGALERLGRDAEAAAIWQQRYERTGDPQALNQATYRLLQSGQPERAHDLLLPAAPFADAAPGPELTDRLLGLLMDRPQPAPVARVRTIVEASERPQVHLAAARLLARDAQCEAGVSGLHDPRFDLYAGTCLAEVQPDRAVERLQRVVAAGEREGMQPLTVALSASGQHAAALAVWQQRSPDELTEADRLAWLQTAIAARDVDAATEAWTQWGDPEDPVWLPLGAATAALAGDIEQARAYWQIVHATDPTPRGAVELSALERGEGNTEAAAQWMGAALDRTPDAQKLWLELGYLLIADDPGGAQEAFETAAALGPLRYDQRLQLAYLQAAAGERHNARASLREAIDGMDADPAPAGVPADTLAEQRFAARRTHEALQRKWEFGISGWLATGSVPGEILFPEQAPRNHVEVRLSRHLLGHRPGRYGPVRGVARFIAEGPSASPYTNRALGLGLQWQPFHLPVILRAEWLEPRFGDGDLVLTAATQILDGGRYRADWRPTETRWWERKLYAEASWWRRSEAHEVFARYDHRHHWRWSERPGSWFVYGLGEARTRDSGDDVRAGLGVGMRFHSGEDRYNAWRQRHTLRLEATRTLTTDLVSDRSGLFLRFDTHW